MKKQVLAIAIASAFSAQAFAAVDFTSTSPVPTRYAAEIDTSGGVTLTAAATELDGEFAFGFGASPDEQRFVRVELSEGAVFNGNPTLSVDAGTGIAGTLSSGGDGESFAIFQVTANDGTNAVAVDNTDVVTISAAALDVEDNSNVTLSYSQYQLAADAVNQTNGLASDSGVLVTFASALDKEVTPLESGDGVAKFIDVTESSTYFTDTAGTTGVQDTTTPIARIQFGLVSPTAPLTVPLTIAGANVALADILDDATLKISGDFTGSGDGSGGFTDLSKVFLDTTPATACDAQATNVDATTLSASEATFNAGANPVDAYVCVTVDGTTTLDNRQYTGVHELTAATDYVASNVALGTVGKITKNGDSAQLNLVLTPEGVFRNFVRITNDSALEGDVFLTAINDDGETATFALGDIAGISSSALAGEASTKLININDIFDAAQAANASFDLAAGSRNKLRLVIDGEFPSIDAQNVTVATDNSTFQTF